MENIMCAGLGKLFMVLFVFVAGVAKAYEVCYETSSYTYYCEDGKECCEGNTACCDAGLSGGAIAGIVIGCIAGVAVLGFLFYECAKKGTPVGTEGQAGQTGTTFGNQSK